MNCGCLVHGSEADRRYFRHAKNAPMAMSITTTATATAIPIIAPVLRERLFPSSGVLVLSKPVEVMVVVEAKNCDDRALVEEPETRVTVSGSATQDVLTTVYHDVAGIGQ